VPAEKAPVKISIITVCWNSEATIEDTLKSVASQTHPLVEHIVVDGQSSDRTMEIVRRYPHIAKVVSERDRGIYDAMNKGLALATGEVIGTLNADDYFADRDVLSAVADAFQDEALEVTYADLCYVDKSDTTRVVRYWRSSDFVPGSYRHGWCPPHPTFFVRRSAYNRYGNFDLVYRIASDVELTMRFLEKHRARFRYLGRVLVHMRLGGTSNKNILNIIRQNREIWQALKTHGLSPSIVGFIIGKIASRGKQFVLRPK
jgi:glycosyltransferase involved in cell wall biosynthesis